MIIEILFHMRPRMRKRATSNNFSKIVFTESAHAALRVTYRCCVISFLVDKFALE